jgi:ankyrin repeat protein
MPANNFILFKSLLNDSYDSFVKKLFYYHSLINNKNEEGETLLHFCSFYGLIEQYYALINIGAEIHKTKSGNSLLHYASLSGKDNFLVIELIKMGISPTEKNIFNETSLHCASNEKIAHYMNVWCQYNNINVFELLDINENTVAHSCKMHGNIDGAKYWITNYPELEFKVNVFNKTWKQCKRKKYTNGLY